METKALPILKTSRNTENFCIVCYESKKTNIFQLGCCRKKLCTSCHLKILKSPLHNSCPNCRTTFNEELQGDENQNLISISPSNIVVSIRDIEILFVLQGILLLWYFYENSLAIGDLVIGIFTEYALFLIIILASKNKGFNEYQVIEYLVKITKLGEGYLCLLYFWMKMMKNHVNVGIIFCLCWVLSHDEDRRNSSWKIFYT